MIFQPKLLTLIKHKKEIFSKENVLRDITAGLVVACIALPLSIALAIASGVLPEQGLLTAVIGGFIVAVLGGTRVQVAGPTGAFVVIVYGIIQQYGLTGLFISTIMAGVILIIMGYLKFGAFLKFIPYPVTTGFTSGIAVVLLSTQINDFLGMGLKDIPAGFIDKINLFTHNIALTNPHTLAIGLLALGIIVCWPKKFKFMPGSLAAIVITTLIVKWFGMDVATIGSTFGQLKVGFSMPNLPDFSTDMFLKLLAPATTIALLAGIESLLSAVVADGMLGRRHRSNTELIATGIANITSGFAGGLPVTGAIARTAANINSGGRTPIAAITQSIALLLMMLIFMNSISLIPMTALAAILFVVCYNMSDWRSFRNLFRAPLSDILVLLTTFSITILKDLVAAIEVGLVLAAILFMKRMSDVYHIKNTDDDFMDEVHSKHDIDTSAVAENVTVYEINGPFFFGAAGVFVETMETMRDCKVLVLRMRSVPAIDATGYHALLKIQKLCAAKGTQIILSHLQAYPHKVLERYGFIDLIGKDNVCDNIDAALVRADKLVKVLK